jgi:hypothetical protein
MKEKFSLLSKAKSETRNKYGFALKTSGNKGIEYLSSFDPDLTNSLISTSSF